MVEPTERESGNSSGSSWALAFDAIRTVSVVLGAVIVFLAIEHPEFLLRRESVEERLAAERAKIALEILKDKDPKIRAESFLVLRTVWGEKEDWIKTIECEAVIEAGYLEAVESARLKTSELQREIEGLGDSGVPGYGPRAKLLEAELAAAESQREYYREQLAYCGFFQTSGGF